jgi:hypothetical protein
VVPGLAHKEAIGPPCRYRDRPVPTNEAGAFCTRVIVATGLNFVHQPATLVHAHGIHVEAARSQIEIEPRVAPCEKVVAVDGSNHLPMDPVSFGSEIDVTGSVSGDYFRNSGGSPPSAVRTKGRCGQA